MNHDRDGRLSRLFGEIAKREEEMGIRADEGFGDRN
jgi:hypothetical protein